MKKTVLYIFILLVATSAIIGCSRQKAISDGELKEIFKEIFIANAFVQWEPIIKTDSLDMYMPILKQYGYDVNDFVYTIENFTKRKSMKLSDVVDEAIKELESEEEFLKGRVAALDSVRVRAQREYSEIIYEDSLINITKIADTAKLRKVFPARLGTYAIRYHYAVDSLDENRTLKTTFAFKNAEGKNSGTTTNWMTAKKRQYYSVEINSQEQDSILEVLFANYPEKGMKKPYLEIDSIRITYLLPVEQALDSLDKQIRQYNLFIRENEHNKTPQDSSALYLYPPRITEEWSDNSGPERENSSN